MGTRALITSDEKPFIATHWDGYPSALGKALLGTRTPEEIINAAKERTIDFATKEVQEICNRERYAEIAAKTNGKYTPEQIAQLHQEGKQLTFGVHAADDSPIGDIDNYGDWAEYQYDFTNNIWRFRELSGSYPDSLDGAQPLKPLTECKD